jgi:hypothetical protein
MSAVDPRDVETAMGWLRSGHIAPLDQDLPADAAQLLAGQVQRCFHTFPDVLQLILDLSLFRPPVDHRLTGEAYLQYAERRRGADQLAASLLYYLELAKQPQGETHGRGPEPADAPRRSRARRGRADPGAGDPAGGEFGSATVALR